MYLLKKNKSDDGTVSYEGCLVGIALLFIVIMAIGILFLAIAFMQDAFQLMISKF